MEEENKCVCECVCRECNLGCVKEGDKNVCPQCKKECGCKCCHDGICETCKKEGAIS